MRVTACASISMRLRRVGRVSSKLRPCAIAQINQSIVMSNSFLIFRKKIVLGSSQYECGLTLPLLLSNSMVSESKEREIMLNVKSKENSLRKRRSKYCK